MLAECRKARHDDLEERLACRGSAMGKPQEAFKCLSRYGVGFVNNERHLPTPFVLGEQGMREGSGQLLGVLCDAIASQLPADYLQDIRRGQLWIKDMNCFEVLQIAMSESGVEQKRFPQPWLSQESNHCLPGLQGMKKSR
jgi:hypothetical protein